MSHALICYDLVVFFLLKRTAKGPDDSVTGRDVNDGGSSTSKSIYIVTRGVVDEYGYKNVS